MRIGPIVLKIRLAETRFEDRVAGAAELVNVVDQTLQKEVAFVVQLAERANANAMDSGINQKITERFGVIVAIDNATTQRDKTGLTAYDTLYEVRTQLFKALLGWQMTGAESLVSYSGGKVFKLTRSNLWYQFEFEASFRIDDEDGVEMGALDDFDSIYADWVLSPCANLPVTEVLPVESFIPDMETKIDFTDDPRAGAFGRGFSIEFDTYKIY